MKQMIAALILMMIVGLAGGLLYAPAAYAAPTQQQGSSPKDLINEGVDKSGGSGTTDTSLNKTLNTITDTLLFLVGAIAVIVIIIGGLRYTTSHGDASQIKAAKDTVLYGVVGVIVALLAYAIVKWIIQQFVAP